MRSVRKKKRQKHPKRKEGMLPGSLVYVGEEKKEEVKINVFNYNESTFEELEFQNVEDCFHYRNKETITWINISGIHNVHLVQKIGHEFGLHPLLIEDILNSEHRPKYTHVHEDLLVILKRLYFDPETIYLEGEQISFFLGDRTLITFQENEKDNFDPVRNQIRQSLGNIRELGADFLMYRLIDTIVDNQIIEIEKMTDHIERLEEEMVKNPSQKLLQVISDYKNQVNILRKLTWPVREVISKLEKRDSPHITESTRFYYSDIYEHTITIHEMVETARTMISGLFDIYFSSVSTKMNEVMKVLTIVSTIFIPLTFIAGIYGMNFAHMPELDSKWGYGIVWLIMITITIIMLIYFKIKKWI